MVATNNEDARPELNPTEARQGMTTGHMRYVLGISLALAVIVMAAIWLMYFG